MTFKRGISISDDSARPLFADTFVLSVSELILWFNVYVVSALFAGPALEGLWVCGPVTDPMSALTRRQFHSCGSGGGISPPVCQMMFPVRGRIILTRCEPHSSPRQQVAHIVMESPSTSRQLNRSTCPHFGGWNVVTAYGSQSCGAGIEPT